MADQEALEELARSRTRDELRKSPSFLSLDMHEQKAMFSEIFRHNMKQLVEATGTGMVPARSGQMSAPRSQAMVQNAGDQIDDDRHLNERIDQAGDLGSDFIQQVDFPQFVSDLLEGVFDANLNVTLKQMETYQELLKTATASVSKFVNAIDDTAAFGYLAENNGDEFSIDFGDGSSGGDSDQQATLTDASGEPLDIGDNEVKSRIMDAKIAMAKEQRLLLRESVMMGLSRLVVEKGNVKASVLFDIKASEEIVKKDRAANKSSTSKGSGGNVGMGLIGKIFGGGSFGGSKSTRKSKISIASVDSKSTTDLSAKVAGSVDITFKSDYFPLDNFADMYGSENASGGAAPAPETGGSGG